MERPDAVVIILARAGSKGVPGKNRAWVGGRPCAAWTIAAARAARGVARVCVSTDDGAIASLAKEMGALVSARPAALASDAARVDDAARHALRDLEAQGLIAADGSRPVVLLYANVPVRPDGLIDRALDVLARTGCDSVQSYAPVGKFHPWWTCVVEPELGRVRPWEGPVLNHGVFRRQDLPPAHIPDGGVLAVTRRALMLEVHGAGDGPHAFLGRDRRGVLTREGEVIDIDTPADLAVAEGALRGAAAPAAPGLAISGRRIGPGHEPYVIAELGVNHDGSVERALELVDAAAEAGADAIKLQLFRADLLMGRAARLADYQRRAGATDPADMLRGLQLSAEALRPVVDRAHQRGVHAIVTVFSTELVEEAERLPWDAYKTASPDVVHRRLLAALARTGKPLLVSTGAATPDEIGRAAGWLAHASDRVGFLQCVSSYPAAEEHAALAGIRALAERLGRVTGYSDHTDAVDTGALAVAAGASILEKHLTYDRGASGPDHAASLDPAGFGCYVRSARRAARMLGPVGKHLLACERDVRQVSRQSLTTRRGLPAGHVLDEHDLCVKRPGVGLEPWRIDDVIGRSLSRAVGADEALSEEDLA
ncbi:MAG: N-acetylneuraminate synthase family protein [Phycisphaerae bacterium]|nr:N-acetylneuraminate synthase family protein [Phycisphaerae bacterium]